MKSRSLLPARCGGAESLKAAHLVTTAQRFQLGSTLDDLADHLRSPLTGSTGGGHLLSPGAALEVTICNLRVRLDYTHEMAAEGHNAVKSGTPALAERLLESVRFELLVHEFARQRHVARCRLEGRMAQRLLHDA
jgi:hypothetical protein